MIAEVLTTVCLTVVVAVSIGLTNQNLHMKKELNEKIGSIVDQVNLAQQYEYEFDKKQLQNIKNIESAVDTVKKDYVSKSEEADSLQTNTLTSKSITGNSYIVNDGMTFNSTQQESSANPDYTLGRGITKDMYDRMTMNFPNLPDAGFNITTTGGDTKFSVEAETGNALVSGSLSSGPFTTSRLTATDINSTGLATFSNVDINGTLLARNNITIPNLVTISSADPGAMIEKNYGTNDGRYGFGQFANGTSRMYAAGSTANSNANLNLSFAKADGTFTDAITIKQDSLGNPSTNIAGSLSTSGVGIFGASNNVKVGSVSGESGLYVGVNSSGTASFGNQNGYVFNNYDNTAKLLNTPLTLTAAGDLVTNNITNTNIKTSGTATANNMTASGKTTTQAANNTAYRQDTSFVGFPTGSSTFVDQIYDNNNLTTSVYRGNGKMGIGISNPSATLHVNGSAIINSNLTANGLNVNGNGSFGNTFVGNTNPSSQGLYIGQTESESAFFGNAGGSGFSFVNYDKQGGVTNTPLNLTGAGDVIANNNLSVKSNATIGGTLTLNKLSTPTVSITAGNGPFVEGNYGTLNNRYGIGLANNAFRTYAAATPNSSINMSFANSDGSYTDAINVVRDGNGNPLVNMNGQLCIGSTCINSSQLANVLKATSS